MILDAVIPRLPVRYFRLFWGYAGARILVVFFLTMVMSYAEAIGIALFFPLFTLGAQSAPTDPIARLFGSVFAFLHLPFSPGAALPIIAGIFVFKGALQYATTIYQVSLTHHVVRELRRRVLRAIGRADYQYLSGKSAGYSANLVVNEVTRAASAFQHFVRSMPPLVNATVLFGIVLFIDWRLTIVCVFMALTMVGFLRFSGRVAAHHSRLFSNESSRLTSLLIQAVHAFKYLRATAGFGVFETRMLETSDRALRADFKASGAGAVMNSIAQPVMVLFLSGVLYYRAVIRGEQLASLFILLIYFQRIMGEMFALQTSWQTFCGYMGSVEMLRDSVDENEANAERGGSEPFSALDEAIVCEGLSFAYRPDVPVLTDIALRIPRRTTVAFVGESGSGKSTLVDLVSGTLRPGQGAVRYDGRALTELDIASVRRRIGYVPQDAIVFDDTVANNIALWRPEMAASRIEAAAQHAHCADFILTMPQGYASQIGDRGVMLSGGQRQRLAIARELVKDPEILILDEATSALDSGSERAIKQSIDELQGKMTIIIIAHRLSTVRSADRIYVLHEGRIVEQGSYDELVAQPNSRFKQMVDLQSLGDRPAD